MIASTITLIHGEIGVAQDDLTLQGPVPGEGTVAISGNHSGRVFKHTGMQTIAINSLVVEDGYTASSNAYGGCISSHAYVFLSNSIVRNCVAKSLDPIQAFGGGIFANSGVTLVASTVTENTALAPQNAGLGGGIYSRGGFVAKYSVISHNLAASSPGYYGKAGGGAASGAVGPSNIFISASTIDHNQASLDSGLDLRGDTIAVSNSTVSDNVGGYALYLAGGGLTVSNVTVAFNHSLASSPQRSGLYLTSFGSIALQSSILAKNTADPAGNVPDSDLYWSGFGNMSGQNNLVQNTTGTAPPLGVIAFADDPKLGPLQPNGGLTPTRELLPTSPAIGQGNNIAGFMVDQRGLGYPRTTGPNTSTDIGAVQFDTIFADAFDF